MRKSILSIALGIAAFCAPAAQAQSTWDGSYLGGFVGYGSGESQWSSGALSTNTFDVDGIMGGLYGGRNWQTGTRVIGIEMELAATGMEGGTVPVCAPGCETELEYYTMVKGRFGAATGSGLIYGALGVGMGSIHQNAPTNGSATDNAFGWTAAFGYEHALQNNWSLRSEVSYMSFDNVSNNIGGTPITVDLENIWGIKLGIARHF